MGFKYRDLAKKTKAVTLDLGDGDSIAVEFRTGLLTPQFLADMQALGDKDNVSPEKLLTVSTHLSRLLTSWDVEDDDGQMFPLDPKRLALDIPLETQLALLNLCIEEMKPGEAKAAAQAPAANA